MNIYRTGDVVVYGAEGLCRIEDITERKFGKEKIRYYVLRQICRNDSVSYVPVDNEKSVSKMRPALTADEVREMIELMPLEKSPWIDNDRERRQAFKEIILYGANEDIIKLVSDLYIRRKEQEAKGRKLYSADERIFKDAENIVFEEIAYALDMPAEKVPDYILSAVAENKRRKEK